MTQGKEVFVCEDNVLVRVTIFVSSFPYDNVLKAEVNTMLLTKINKKAPMNT